MKNPRRPFGLNIVAAGHELTGAAPALMERAAKLASPGEPTHRGLIWCAAALARHGIRACAPPGALQPSHAALEAAEAWVNGRGDAHAVRKARSEAFAAVIGVERRTIDAVCASLQRLERKPHTAIDEHADSVVLRFAGLAANYACGAVLLTLDAVDEPAQSALVPQQVAGAIAYQSVGLGAARSGQLRAAALEQAEWESGRQAAPRDHGAQALAVQLFHEFLGAAWKTRSDSERLFLDEFADWALLPLKS